MNIASSGEQNYCKGYFPSSKNDKYVLGFNLSIGVTNKILSHSGSTILDFTNAFDKAEVAEANIGQTNMITVSSFCGPEGLIWGYDLMQKDKQSINFIKLKNAPAYSAQPLFDATKQLLGTVDKPLFPILPGSHVLAAVKNHKLIGEGVIYASIAIGITNNREKSACLLMEDVGEIPLNENHKIIEKTILQNLYNSVLEIGINQRVEYKEIFLGIKYQHIKKDQISCALICAPYLALPIKVVNLLNQKENISPLDISNLVDNSII